jgi:hypothetical protein
MSAKPAPMVCVTDEELLAALRATKALKEGGEDSPDFRRLLRIALDLVAKRDARERQIALLWAEPLMTNEWEKVQ